MMKRSVGQPIGKNKMGGFDMAEEVTNFKFLKKSRRKPERGDIFTFQLIPLPDRFFFGRVICTDSRLGYANDVILIYIYKTPSQDKNIVPKMHPSDLLIPPVGTNRLAWTDGFFELVRNEELKQDDKLAQHCFLKFLFPIHNPDGTKTPRPNVYLDEYGARLSGPSEPVGLFGLSGYLGIDEDISKALDIPVAE